jgi:hypothetical protein
MVAAKTVPDQEELILCMGGLPFFCCLLGPGCQPVGRVISTQFADSHASLETPSQTCPKVCFSNFLGVSQSCQVDNQDETSHHFMLSLCLHEGATFPTTLSAVYDVDIFSYIA